jgi:pimeloyl-[acyl-carrier protein] methyl ester esterase
MSKIWQRQTGRGPDLVLIHGWGLHGGIWDGLVPALARHCRVTVVDLPGHGHSDLDPQLGSVDGLAEQLLAVVPEGAMWLGWSLGGLVALAAAAGYRQQVAGLILVGATPRFVSADDWPNGMAPDVLAGFADRLDGDYEGTLRRFIGLHVGAGADSRETLRALRSQLFAHGRPSEAALSQGLRFLRETDLRARLGAIAQPVTLIQGSYDRLVPPSAAEWLAAHLRTARLHTISRAGHAPFLSHPDEFATQIMAAMQEEVPVHAR